MIDVRLDRITVVGSFKLKSDEKFGTYLRKIGWMDMSFDFEHGFVDGFKLERDLGGSFENVAVIVKNQYQTTWRLDTSNHLKDKEKETILAALDLLENRHLSRIDIAFDFINEKHSGMLHRFTKPNVTSTEVHGESLWMRGRSGQLQTIYAGKRKSLSLFRYYDKVAEQKAHRKEVAEDIKTWERLELQVRGTKASEWLANAKVMLSYFKLPEENKLDPKTRAMLVALNNGVVSYSELSPNTRSKYRKMARDNEGYDDTWARSAYLKLKEKEKDLQNEVDSFLVKMKIHF